MQYVVLRGAGQEFGTLVGAEAVEDTADGYAEGASAHPPNLLAGTGRCHGFSAATRLTRSYDWDNQRVTCPQGTASTIWAPCTERKRRSIVVRFPTTACQRCPVRAQCTTSTRNGRQLMLRPREIHEAVERARTEQTTDEWKDRYAVRPGIEGTIHQAVAVTGIRYTSLPKTHLAHVFAATAVNLIRLDAWWTGNPLDRDRTSHLTRLGLTLTT
ncbi:transposase [Streptantibioticus rubrisoli]|uniref:transposase n=1 Tax=Streptantibioticus rubrisoli TaxID=1387313 RepID=UPI0027E23BBB|nr:transposase [Streptantibioticus rubrisoli]